MKTHARAGLLLGLLLAIAGLIAVVVAASTGSPVELGPIDFARVTRTKDASGSSATLSLRPGAAVLVLLPLLGWYLGRSRKRAS